MSDHKRKDLPTSEEKDPEEEEEFNKDAPSSGHHSNGSVPRIDLTTLPVVGDNLNLIEILGKPLTVNPSEPTVFRVQVSNPNSPIPDSQDDDSEESLSESELQDSNKVLTIENCDCDRLVDDTIEMYESVVILPYSETLVTTSQQFFIYRAIQFDGFCRKQRKLAVIFPNPFLLKLYYEIPSTDHIFRSAVYLKTRSHEDRWETCYSGSISLDPRLRKEQSCVAELNAPIRPFAATHQQSFRIYATSRKNDFNVTSNPVLDARINASFTLSTQPRKETEKSSPVKFELPPLEPSFNGNIPHKFILVNKRCTVLKIKHPNPKLAMKHQLVRHSLLCCNNDVLHCFVALLPDNTFSDFSWESETEDPLQNPASSEDKLQSSDDYTWRLTVLSSDHSSNKKSSEEIKKKSSLREDEDTDIVSLVENEVQVLKSKVVLEVTFTEKTKDSKH